MPRDRYDDEDDDHDDRPRRRRRRDDDDDDFDRRPRPKAGGGGKTVLIVLAIVGVSLLVVCGGGLALLWPQFERIGAVRSRAAAANNLKQTGLSLHNFHDTTGTLPRPFLDTDRDGVQVQPPSDPANRLSWRVSLLPYLYDGEADAAYRRFNIREPWNSPTNSPLKDTPIRAYRHPLDAQEKGEPVTRMRCFYDNGAVFEAKPHARVTLLSISDGTSNTILYVESADAVSWTPFNDFRYSPTTPLPAFGHPKIPGGFQVVLGDASVRFISNRVQERTIRQLITRADGEVIFDPDW
jgi:hypothetical protein